MSHDSLTDDNLDSLYRLQELILDPKRTDAEVRSLSRLQVPLILLRIERRRLNQAAREGVRCAAKCDGCGL